MVKNSLHRCECSECEERGEENDRLREALKEAIDVFEGMNDDEISLELLPRMRKALTDGN